MYAMAYWRLYEGLSSENSLQTRDAVFYLPVALGRRRLLGLHQYWGSAMYLSTYVVHLVVASNESRL